MCEHQRFSGILAGAGEELQGVALLSIEAHLAGLGGRLGALRGADGVFRQFLTRVQPLKNSEGRVVRWFGTNTDVDELKRTEEKLRESEERYRGIFEHAGAHASPSPTSRAGSSPAIRPTRQCSAIPRRRALVFADHVDPQDREAYLAESRRLLERSVGGKVDLDYAPSGTDLARPTCPAANAHGAEAAATGTIERT
jgi:hypothetical protein